MDERLGILATEWTRAAGKHLCGARGTGRGDIDDVRIEIDSGDVVGDFDGRRHGFVAQPVEQSETRIDAPVVLRESYEIPASKIVVCDSEAAGRGIRIAEQEIGEIVSGACDGRAIDEFAGEQSGEGKLAAGIGIRVCV